jgi:hypothetical protein
MPADTVDSRPIGLPRKTNEKIVTNLLGIVSSPENVIKTLSGKKV